MARLRSTLLIVAHRSPMLSAGSISGPPHSNWWWCHDIGYPLSAAEHSPCTAPWSGTLCRKISVHSRTMSPLNRAWKPGFSLGTSMFGALETFVTIALYKSIFTIPYHWVCSAWRWLSIKLKLHLFQLVVDLLSSNPQEIHNKSNKWSLSVIQLFCIIFQSGVGYLRLTKLLLSLVGPDCTEFNR